MGPGPYPAGGTATGGCCGLQKCGAGGRRPLARSRRGWVAFPTRAEHEGHAPRAPSAAWPWRHHISFRSDALTATRSASRREKSSGERWWVAVGRCCRAATETAHDSQGRRSPGGSARSLWRVPLHLSSPSPTPSSRQLVQPHGITSQVCTPGSRSHDGVRLCPGSWTVVPGGHIKLIQNTTLMDLHV